MKNVVGQLAIALNHLNEAIEVVARSAGCAHSVEKLRKAADEITAPIVEEGYRRDAEPVVALTEKANAGDPAEVAEPVTQ